MSNADLRIDLGTVTPPYGGKLHLFWRLEGMKKPMVLIMTSPSRGSSIALELDERRVDLLLEYLQEAKRLTKDANLKLAKEGAIHVEGITDQGVDLSELGL